MLHRVAQPVKRADAGVAAPREAGLALATEADQLVIDHVGGHAHEREVAPALTGNRGGRVRDEVGGALERDDVAVPDESRRPR